MNVTATLVRTVGHVGMDSEPPDMTVTASRVGLEQDVKPVNIAYRSQLTHQDSENNAAPRLQSAQFIGANMGPTLVLSAPDGPHVGPMNLAIRDDYFQFIL